MNTKIKCFVTFSGNNRYTPDKEAGKVEFNQLPENTYFCMGFKDEKDTGKAMLFCNEDGGTCLIPIFDMNGNNIYIPEYAGKEIKNGQVVNS